MADPHALSLSALGSRSGLSVSLPITAVRRPSDDRGFVCIQYIMNNQATESTFKAEGKTGTRVAGTRPEPAMYM